MLRRSHRRRSWKRIRKKASRWAWILKKIKEDVTDEEDDEEDEEEDDEEDGEKDGSLWSTIF